MTSVTTDDAKALTARFLREIADAKDLTALDAIRREALGKKGAVSSALKGLGTVEPDKRKDIAQAYNEAKARIAEAIEQRQGALEEAALEERLKHEYEDVTLPAPPRAPGSLHLLSFVAEEMVSIFSALGFSVYEGPQIESDDYNFTALNFPAHHPAREMHDTFFLKPGPDGERKLLRTHTSPVQVRAMRTLGAPLRIITPAGRVYRHDSDQTHTPMFHQMEALYVDKGAHMGHLKGALEAFARAFFEVEHVETRIRPSFFPFTEPSIEMDVRCDRSGGQVRVGEGDDWLEILGGGMVHPNVIAAGGLDPEVYTGFAFGMGADRVAMLKYGAPDLRDFFHGEKRWLAHYGFPPEARPPTASLSLLREPTS
jgi:phenylalanyl-tRNA synthetase alpha chain